MIGGVRPATDLQVNLIHPHFTRQLATNYAGERKAMVAIGVGSLIHHCWLPVHSSSKQQLNNFPNCQA